ncbi:sensor histidine kinase [Pseudactinotalea terrae]|uniref:sensor histidine kinase n=1 Tax=Pseudactinotalea terrae TaxID=1743262 RepID=UPI001F4FD60B|nr:sensor histidine kinase [Pseudactinotalea terrae]
MTAPPTETSPQPSGGAAPTPGEIWFAVILTVAFALVPIAYGGVGGAARPVLAISTLIGIAQLIALIWRRSHPERTATVVAALAVAHFALGQFLQPSDVAVLVALYSVTAFRPGGSSRTWLLIAMGGAVMVGVGFALSDWAGMGQALAIATFLFVGCAALALTAWALGLVRRARYLQQESLAERAARLERERDQLEQIATQAERTRIAREMHDIVAHSLSVVIAQADGGRYAAKTSPEAAERALLTISETGRAALADMRRILGVLRTDGHDANDLVPQPGDTDVATLVTSMKDTLPVSLIEMGTPRALPPGTGATIYRIAQESLTNILKHGGPEVKATVLMQWAPQHVVLQVDDDGRGAAAVSDGAGHGVLGMRERAAMLGGTLSAGPRAGGGYRVRAEIPVPGGASGPRPEPPTTPAPPIDQRTP